MSHRPSSPRRQPSRAALGLGLALAAAVLPPAASAGATMTIEVRDGLVSAMIEETSVEAAVRALGDAVGAEVVVHGDPGPAARQRFADLPFEAALRRLVAGNGFTVRYAPSEAEGGPPRPREIRLYARGAATAVAPGAPPPLPMPKTPGEMTARVSELIESGDEAAMDELASLYARARDPATRRALVAGLSQQRDPATGEVLARALGDPETAIRILAARGLWASRGTASVALLEAAARRERDPATRQALAQLLKLAERQRPD
jgi:hypothetical protein